MTSSTELSTAKKMPQEMWWVIIGVGSALIGGALTLMNFPDGKDQLLIILISVLLFGTPIACSFKAMHLTIARDEK